MDNILTISDDNLGGLSTIEFAPTWFFSSISSLTFIDGYGWIKIECITESMKLTEDPDQDDHGSFINFSASGQLPKIRSEVEAVLDLYRHHPCLVKMKDNNNKVRLAGTFAGDILLIDPSSTGTQVSDENGTQILFKGTQERKALFL